MNELLLLTINASTTSNLPVPIPFVIGGLLVAAIIIGVSIYLFRSSGKKKGAKAPPTGASDWQQQAQQGSAGGWNAPGMPAENAWSQQPGGSWNQQAPQANTWGQSTQQAGGWSTQGADQQSAGGWGTPGSAQQPASSWNAQNPSQQSAAPWSTQISAQQQQQAGTWGQPAQGTAGPTQQPSWGRQNFAQPSPSASPWSSAGSQSANPWASQGAQAPWEPSSSAQDSWAQPSSAAPQPTAPWGSGSTQPGQSPSPAQGAGSAQPWGQQAASGGQGSADRWSNSVAQQQYPGMGTPAAPPSSPPAMPSWQQSGTASGGVDADKTILRSIGPQVPGTLGFVRVEEGKEPGRVYEIRKEQLSIGRSRDSDIFLEDLAVSRLHASIVNTGTGNYALKDEGSANGTKVNGQLVQKYQQHPLQEGDRIQLGQTVLVFGRR